MPYGVEAVSGYPVEIFMMPPAWRGDVMCPAPDDMVQTYQYTDGMCVPKCVVPGCGAPTTPTLPQADIEQNMAAAREGLDLFDVYNLGIEALRYGTILVAMSSIGVMSMGRPVWYVCALCMVMAVWSFFEPILLWGGVACLVASYGIDMWSTSRFGHDIARYEANPILRALYARYGMASFMMHSAIYAGVISVAYVILSLDGHGGMVAPMLYILAAGHVIVATGNIREYKLI